jgi:peptide methionine sulfoxide reductase msrA/msrB
MLNTIRLPKQCTYIALSVMMVFSACKSEAQRSPQSKQDSSHNSKKTMEGTMRPEFTAHLTPKEYDVLVNKATDPPSEGGYTNLFDEGEYHCRACGALLYKSDSKFKAHCGWAAFDTEVKGAVKRIADNSYGMVRTEILCTNCGGHLGHVFEGEGYTATNTRHCVNTSSLVFHPKNKQTIYVGLGQFYNTQAIFQKVNGVLYTETGVAGAENSSLNIAELEAGKAKGIEVVKVEFDPTKISLEKLIAEYFNAYSSVSSSLTQSIPAFAPIILTTTPEQSVTVSKLLEEYKRTNATSTIATSMLSNYTKAELEHQNVVRKQSALRK